MYLWSMGYHCLTVVCGVWNTLPGTAMVQIDSALSTSNAFEQLAAKGYHSVPVYDQKKKQYVGFLDTADLVTYVVRCQPLSCLTADRHKERRKERRTGRQTDRERERQTHTRSHTHTHTHARTLARQMVAPTSLESHHAPHVLFRCKRCTRHPTLT